MRNLTLFAYETMKFTEEIIIGLIGAALYALLEYIWKTSLAPGIRAILYRGPSIQGKWASYDADPDSTELAGHAEIEQRGTSVKMTLTRVRSRSGKVINRVFAYRGTFSEGQLTVLFEDQEAEGYITGAMVLRLQSDVRGFVGKTTYFDHSANRVVSHDFWLKKAI